MRDDRKRARGTDEARDEDHRVRGDGWRANRENHDDDDDDASRRDEASARDDDDDDDACVGETVIASRRDEASACDDDDDDDDDDDAWAAAAASGDGATVLAMLLAPMSLETFERECVGRRVVCARGNEARARRGRGWFSLEATTATLRDGEARYGVDVDVTSYAGGARRTHNSNGDGVDGDDAREDEIADAEVCARRFREEKCSLRLLHPQARDDETWKILAALENYFDCACGCNVYVTPKQSQGFAPHHDDIDAFVVQLEGEKRWRVYEPFPDDARPRTSSRNFTQDEVATLRVVFDDVLREGDVLYLPRGFVHQAECSATTHSVHATVSSNQSNAPADALEIAVTNALAAFVRATPRARKNLPRDRSSEAYIDANVAVSRAFASLALDEDAFAPFLAHAMESLRARFTMQRLPPPETFLERSSASCTGDVAADELRTGARTRVAIQMRGGVCVLHDDPYRAYHPFRNRRDGCHARVFGVDNVDDDDDDDTCVVVREEKVVGLVDAALDALEAADGEATRVDDIVDVAFNDAHAVRSPTLERALRRYLCEFVRQGALAAVA